MINMKNWVMYRFSSVPKKSLRIITTNNENNNNNNTHIYNSSYKYLCISVLWRNSFNKETCTTCYNFSPRGCCPQTIWNETLRRCAGKRDNDYALHLFHVRFSVVIPKRSAELASFLRFTFLMPQQHEFMNVYVIIVYQTCQILMCFIEFSKPQTKISHFCFVRS